jgi:DNA-3-methyladenine glycosylase
VSSPVAAAGEAIAADFFARDTLTVARELIGVELVREIDGRSFVARIVETEAYREDDPASHSFRGPTDRCRVMFGPPGIAYVYLSYGVHHCLNVVTEPEGCGCAVLIRAIEPLGDLEPLWHRRFPSRPFDLRRRHQLTNGPGKLTAAYAITRESFDGHRLDRPPLLFRRPATAPTGGSGETPEVAADVRIGISKGTELLRRFYEVGNPFVSRAGNSCSRAAGAADRKIAP